MSMLWLGTYMSILWSEYAHSKNRQSHNRRLDKRCSADSLTVTSKNTFNQGCTILPVISTIWFYRACPFFTRSCLNFRTAGTIDTAQPFHSCCIFWPEFGCCALQTLVELKAAFSHVMHILKPRFNLTWHPCYDLIVAKLHPGSPIKYIISIFYI